MNGSGALYSVLISRRAPQRTEANKELGTILTKLIGNGCKSNGVKVQLTFAGYKFSDARARVVGEGGSGENRQGQHDITG